MCYFYTMEQRRRKKRRAVVLQKALGFLTKLVVEHAEGNGVRLPSVRALSREAGVSVFTMAKAVTTVRRHGVISIVPNKGIFTGKSAPVPAKRLPLRPKRQVPAAQRIAERIGRDILTGRFSHPEVLPGYKELRLRYGASNPTLQDAIAVLKQHGLIEPVLGRHRVRTFSPARNRAAIVLLPAGSADGVPVFLNDRSYEMMRVIEKECITSAVTLQTVPYIRSGPQTSVPGYLQEVGARTRNRTVLGYIVIGSMVPSPHEVVRYCLRTGLPVSTLVERESEELPDSLLTCGNLSAVTLAYGTVPGRIAGRYLVESGHRSVAFFDPYAHERWAMERFTGMREIFGDAGCEDVPVRYTMTPSGWENAARITGRFDALISDLENEHGAAVLSPLKRRFETFRRWVLNDEQFRFSLDSAMETALRSQHATAWVGANDQTALILLDYLREKKVAVPKDVSVLGFDNLAESQVHDLTSIDFNMTMAAHALIRFVLQPARYRRIHAAARTVIGCDLVIRGSSSAMPRSK